MKNEMHTIGPAQMIALGRAVHAGLMILNARLFTLLALACSAAMFTWVIYAPDPLRLATAAAFAILVYLPVLRLETQRRDAVAAAQPPQETEQ